MREEKISRREQRLYRHMQREQEGVPGEREKPMEKETNAKPAPEVKLTKQREQLEKKLREKRENEEQLAGTKKAGLLDKLLGKKTPVEKTVIEQEKKLSEIEVTKFHEEHNRPPSEQELNELAENLYEQVREGPAQEKTTENITPEKTGLGKQVIVEEIKGRESLTEMRKRKRSLIEVVEGDKQLATESDRAKTAEGTAVQKSAEENMDETHVTPRERFLKRRAERMQALVEQKAQNTSNALEGETAEKETGYSRSRRRRAQAPGAADTLKEQKAKGKKNIAEEESAEPKVSMKELLALGEENDEEGEEDLGLGELEEGEESELGELEGLEGEEAPKVCPNCKAKNANIVFCSKCGTAFCSTCTAGKETVNGKVKLACPKCKTKVSV